MKIIANFYREVLTLKPIRQTRRGGNSIYLFKAHEAPILFKEVARFREVTYQARGGGTGKLIDEDDFDLRKNPYRQVIIWNEEHREIVGGFRYGLGEEGNFATESLYNFSKLFLKELHPKTMDIGRMFIQPDYQSLGKRKEGIFSLENLWDALGSIISLQADVKYLIGRVVSFREDKITEQMIADFFAISFPTDSEVFEPLMLPKKPYFANIVYRDLFQKREVEKNYKILLKQARENRVSITPLILAYLRVAKALKYMGTTLDTKIGVLQSCILIKVDDIYPHFKKRHFL